MRLMGLMTKPKPYQGRRPEKDLEAVKEELHALGATIVVTDHDDLKSAMRESPFCTGGVTALSIFLMSSGKKGSHTCHARLPIACIHHGDLCDANGCVQRQ